MERTIMSKEIEEQISVLEKIEAKNQKTLTKIAEKVQNKKITQRIQENNAFE